MKVNKIVRKIISIALVIVILHSIIPLPAGASASVAGLTDPDNDENVYIYDNAAGDSYTYADFTNNVDFEDAQVHLTMDGTSCTAVNIISNLTVNVTPGITYREAFPDEVFREYVLNEVIGDGRTAGDEISPQEVLKMAVVIDLNIPEKAIKSLIGIKYFSGLETLSASFNELTTLDLSENKELLLIDVSSNQLTEMIAPISSSLQQLYINDNQLTELNISSNTELNILVAGNNKLSSLNISNNHKLSILDLYNNNLTGLDVTNNSELLFLAVDYNNIENPSDVIGRNTSKLVINESFIFYPQYSHVIPAPTGLNYDGVRSISWNPVAGAYWYYIYAEGFALPVLVSEALNVTTFDLQTIIMSYTNFRKLIEDQFELKISVAAFSGTAANEPLFISAHSDPYPVTMPIKLETPVITINEDGYTLSWAAVSGANKYIIYAESNGSTAAYSVAENSLTYSLRKLNLDTGEYNIRIRAVAMNEVFAISELSDTVEFTQKLLQRLATPIVRRDGTVLSWNRVDNADYYAIYADGNEVTQVESLSIDLASLKLKAGQYQIQVVACCSDWVNYRDSEFSTAISISVAESTSKITADDVDWSIIIPRTDLTYGARYDAAFISAFPLTGVAFVDGSELRGELTVKTPSATIKVGSNNVVVVFTVTTSGLYKGHTAEKTYVITADKAVPVGIPIFTPITSPGKTLADAYLSFPSGGFTDPNSGAIVSGTLSWDHPSNTVVELYTSYRWTFVPAYPSGYKSATGLIMPYTQEDAQLPIKLALVVSFDSYSVSDGDKIITYHFANLVDLEGKVFTVPTISLPENEQDLLKGVVCTYTIASSLYAFVAAPAEDKTEDKYRIRTNIDKIENGSYTIYPSSFQSVVNYTTNMTKFVVVNYDNSGEPDGTVTVYTGRNNVPSFPILKQTTAVSFNVDGQADEIAEIVYIYDSAASTKVEKLVYVLGTYSRDYSGYQLDVIRDGVYDTIYAVNVTQRDMLLSLKGKLIKLSTLNGEIDGAPIEAACSTLTSIRNYGGLLMINGTYQDYSIANDVPVYVIEVPDGKVGDATGDSYIAADFTNTVDFEDAQVHLATDGTRCTAVYIISNQPVNVTPSITYHEAFPDEIFREYVLNEVIGDGRTAGDNIKVPTDISKMAACTVLDLLETGIKELKGIEYFTGLQVLDVSFNEITTLDLSANNMLVILFADNNKLSTLNIHNCNNLQELYICDNQLTELDISRNTDLRNLIISRNQLSNLDVSSNRKLSILDLYNNNLTGLDVTNNSELFLLAVDYNNMASLESVVGWQNHSKLVLNDTFSFYPQKSQPVTLLRINASPAVVVTCGETISFDLILNEGADAGKIIWSVSNPLFATVDSSGTVSVLNTTGTVTLIASDPNSGKQHSVILRIRAF